MFAQQPATALVRYQYHKSPRLTVQAHAHDTVAGGTSSQACALIQTQIPLINRPKTGYVITPARQLDVAAIPRP